MSEELKEDTVVKVDPVLNLAELIKIPVEKVKAWKGLYRKLYKTMLGEDVYVYRALTRLEYKMMQGDLMINPNATANEREIVLEEALVQRCLLFPDPMGLDWFNNTKAGTVSSIVRAIQWNSDFLPPEVVISSTEEI
jgi:hypothetical protein